MYKTYQSYVTNDIGFSKFCFIKKTKPMYFICSYVVWASRVDVDIHACIVK